MFKFLVYALYFGLLITVEVTQTDWIDRFYLFDLIHSLKLQLLFLLLLVALVIALFNKLVCALFVSFTLVYILYHFSFTERFTEPQINQFRVNQFNLNYENPYTDSFYQSDLTSLAELTVLFELRKQDREQFIKMRARYFDFGSDKIEPFPNGIGVISKYPILNSIQHRGFLNSEKGVIIELHLAVASDYLRLFVLHPPSPRSEVLWRRRNEILSYLTSLINKDSRFKHTLVVADFNTPPWSHFFSYPSSMTSCYEYSGHYASWLPSPRFLFMAPLAGLPIDNCLLSPSLSISSFETIYQNGSDHALLSYDVNIHTSQKNK